jgi:2-methylcitrate dehydratase PrpD
MWFDAVHRWPAGQVFVDGAKAMKVASAVTQDGRPQDGGMDATLHTHEPDGPRLSATLARVLAETRFDALPHDVVGHARLALLDWFGSALAGACEPPAAMARAVAASLGRADEATAFPDQRMSGAAAALANGVAAHILELDDVHRGSTLHAAAPVVSAALAVAERERASGADLLRAIVLGYEAAFRIGEAVNPSHYAFWHPTGTVATFGAAVAAGSLLRLDADGMRNALGSAGTQAAGLWEFNTDGAMSKHLHPGKAAFDGILAADLARLGFTGASRILEGERGFFRAMSREHDPTRITDDLGVDWKIGENCYKIHACCGHTHSAIDLALALRRERGWTADEAVAAIQAIRIETYGPGYAIVRNPNPRTPYQAKFSIAYVVAAALLAGEVGLAAFPDDRFGPKGVTDPRLAALLACTTVEVAPDLTAAYPERWPARLTVTLADGEARRSEAAYPRGNPENPVDAGTLEAKASALIAPRYGPALAARAIAFVRDVEELPDIQGAMRGMMNGAE